MRILYFSEHFWPRVGGIEVISAQLVTALRKRGHEVTVVASDGDGSFPAFETYGGVPVHRFDLTRALLERNVDSVMASRVAVARLCRELRPDVIHAVFSSSVFYTTRLATSRSPFILSFHAWNWERRADRETLLTGTVSAATWLTTCSHAIRRDLCAVNPGIAERSSVIHNGLEAPPREVATLPNSPPVIMAVGRLSPEKGFDVLLDAFAQVVATLSNVRLVLVGDGEERPALEARARTLGVLNAVSFTGWIAPGDVGSALDRATVAVVPSRSEAFGLSALEAAIRGRPVVAARVGGLSEALGNEDTAVFFEPEQSGELATALLALLTDEERARRLGLAARKRALRLFSADRTVTQHEVLYRQLINGLH